MGKNLYRFGLLFADLVVIVGTFRLAYWLRYEWGGFSSRAAVPPFGFYWSAVLLAMGLWILLFRLFELDSVSFGWGSPLAISRIGMASVTFVISLLAGSYLASTYYSRLLLTILSFLFVIFLLLTRIASDALLGWLRNYGFGLRRVVIVGQSVLAREIAERIRMHQELHYELVGFLYPVSSRRQGNGAISAVHGPEEIARELAGKRIDELIFTLPIRRDTEILELIACCQKQGICVRVVPEYYELHASQVKSFSIDGIPILELRETSPDPFNRVVKAVMDYSLATLLFALLLPPMIFVGVVLALLTKRRALKREVRVGLEGRAFVMYRFDIDRAEIPLRPKGRNWDIRYCRFLQRYSLSELPQLWNVLKGEMSIVGPRPETPERVQHYSTWHKRRLRLKPGMTGLAQVKGVRGFDSSDLKTKYDLEYGATFSPVWDLALMVATLGTLLARRYGPERPLRPGAPRSETLRAELT